MNCSALVDAEGETLHWFEKGKITQFKKDGCRHRPITNKYLFIHFSYQELNDD